MTLRHMKIYLAVYQTENVTRAARELNMTQPAVTRAIQEIEHYYGIRLFERINRRLSVTELGKEFYAYALHIVDSFDQMERELRNWDEFGLLRVGTSVSIGNFLLPRVLAAFRRSHPNLRVKAQVSNGQSLQNALLENRLDFAVIEGNVSNELLNTSVIGEDRLVPVLPPEDPHRGQAVPLKELMGQPLLLREIGSVGRSFLDHVFALHGITAAPVLESISTQALLQAVHTGLGVSFLPEQLVRERIAGGFVSTCTVTDETFCRSNHLVWHRNKHLTPSAKQLMELFRTLF